MELRELREYSISVLSQDSRPAGRHRTNRNRMTATSQERLLRHQRERQKIKGRRNDALLEEFYPRQDPKGLLIGEEPRLKNFHFRQLLHLSNAEEESTYGAFTASYIISILTGSTVTTQFLFGMLQSVLDRCTRSVQLLKESEITSPVPAGQTGRYPFAAILPIRYRNGNSNFWGTLIGHWHTRARVRIQRLNIHQDPFEPQVSALKGWFHRLDTSLEFDLSDIEFSGTSPATDTSMLVFSTIRAIFLRVPLCHSSSDFKYERYRRIFELGLLGGDEHDI